VLYTQQVFIPFDTGMSKGTQETLATAVAEARKAGYPIRVAVIEKTSDLGAVTVLWGKPRQYARFLDLELSFAYKGPLLVVMPGGIGYAHFHRSTAAEYRALAAIPVQPDPDGLGVTATRSVERLARRAGHPIAAPASSPGTDLPHISRLLAAGVVLALVSAALLVYAVFGWRLTRATRHDRT